MLRIMIRIILLLFVVVGMVFYLFYLRTGGGDLQSIRKLIPPPKSAKTQPDLRQLSKMPALNSVEISEKDLREIVRWQDENGIWHFSNEKQAAPGVADEKPGNR